MSHPLLPPENDHDAIANLWPRMAAVEETQARLERGQERLDRALTDLREEIRRTEERLGEKVEQHQREIRTELSQRFEAVEAHLTRQDDQLLSLRGRWNQGAIIATTAAATLAVGLVLAVVSHLHF